METLKATYRDILTADPTDLMVALTERLPILWSEVARDKEGYDNGGPFDFDDPCTATQKQIGHLIGLLKRAHADLNDLRSHQHVWDRETDYCQICGADGRA